MRFFPSYGSVSTTLWLHYVDANKTHEEKARWELYRDVMCCCEQILEPKFHKTAAI